MDENKSWVQIKVACDARDLDTVSSVMSMVDNGLMIEDFSDVDQILCLSVSRHDCLHLSRHLLVRSISHCTHNT